MYLRRAATARGPHPLSRAGLSSLIAVETDSVNSKIAHVRLSRHEGKNAFSRQMVGEFVAMVAGLKLSVAEKRTNVIVLSSSVPKVFCAGADLKERAGMPEDQVAGFVDSLREAFGQLEELGVPTIAAIEGVALGGGLELALCCDLRVVGKDAVLGLPETALAIIPGAGGTQRLPRLIGACKAKELIFLAKRLSADEAAKYGVVNEVVAAGQAVPRALELAHIMAAHGPLALRLAKRAVDAGLQAPTLAQGLAIEKSCYAQVVPTADRREGLRAFVEKRKPIYLCE